MKKLLNKKGFTLVELLAVIVVLAIVMIMATREITKYMNKSKGNALYTQARALQREINSECIINDGITKDEVVAIANKDEIFKESSSITVTATNSTSGKVVIKLAGTSFANLILPTKAAAGITPSGNLGESMSDGTITIEYSCLNQ